MRRTAHVDVPLSLPNAMLRKLLFLLLSVISIVVPASAQRQRNYIYIFDCTQSMEWKNIWQPAKTALDRTIEVQRMQPDASFSVIPFQGTVHPMFVFDASSYPSRKGDISKAFDSYISTKTNTNIADALSEGLGQCLDERVNRIYLLTDGKDNVKGTSAVCKIIERWCADHTNTRFFYVTLAEDAVDPDIVAAINRCEDAFFVTCHNGVIPQLADISPSRIHANTLELDATHRLMFSEPGSYALRTECDDPWFVPEIKGGKAENQTITLSLRTRSSMSAAELNEALATSVDSDGNYIFRFRIISDVPGIAIVNPEITVVMSMRRQRSLTLCGGPFDELVVKPGSSSYPPFLFSAEKLPEIICFDLAPEFNDAAGPSSSATFSIAPAKNSPSDFTLYFNGEPLENESTFTLTPGTPAILGIEFEPEAKTGKRYFTLVPVASSELELINGTPVTESDDMTIRTTYSRDWNPLATICFWTAIILLAALVLWFAVLKPIFYPRFKIGALSFVGPKTYYVRKRVRKYRTVVLTSHKRNQGFFSKLFTGSILYISAPHWTPELTITPGNKKTCRVSSQKSWDIVPSRTLKQHETYEFINNMTGDKSTLTVE